MANRILVGKMLIYSSFLHFPQRPLRIGMVIPSEPGRTLAGPAPTLEGACLYSPKIRERVLS